MDILHWNTSAVYIKIRVSDYDFAVNQSIQYHIWWLKDPFLTD